MEKSANINGNSLKSPISRAIKHGHMDIIVYLVKQGADISEENCKKILLQVSQVSRINTTLKKKLLYIAARNGYLEVVEHLLVHFPRLDASFKEKLLFVAAKNAHFDIFNWLLCDGLDENMDSYQKALSYCMKASHMSAIFET